MINILMAKVISFLLFQTSEKVASEIENCGIFFYLVWRERKLLREQTACVRKEFLYFVTSHLYRVRSHLKVSDGCISVISDDLNHQSRGGATDCYHTS